MRSSPSTTESRTCSATDVYISRAKSRVASFVTIQNNGGDTLTQNTDGSFTFLTLIAEGSSYAVTVSSQPSTQTCPRGNGTGTMGSSPVINVQVTCSTNTYTVGGTISGLVGSVSLQNNGSDTLTQNTDGSLTFLTPIAEGSSYAVTVS